MLISYNGELTRLQCAFVDTPEVDEITEFIGDQRGYPQPFLLPEYVDELTWERVVAYVVACVPLLTQDDDRDFLICARTIYKKYGKLVEAMTLSIRLDNMEFIEQDFADAKEE